MGYGIHLGSFLLLAATVLLLVATISAPVVHSISFLNVVNGGTTTHFGTFGYCQGNTCSPREVGYNIASVAGAVSNFTYVNNHLYDVTKAFVLTPVACGLSFIAMLVALASHRLGFIFAALVTFAAFIVSLVVMVLDFVVFGIVKHEINSNTSASASFSTAIWLALAATIILFFATFIVFFETCTVGARRRRDDTERYAPAGYVGNQPAPMSQPYGAGRTWYGRRKY